MWIINHNNKIVCFWGIFVLFMNSSFAQIKVGVDLNGEHKISGEGVSETEEVETGFSFGVENFWEVDSMISFGLGTEYQIGRSQVDFDGDFRFESIYGVIKLNINSKKSKGTPTYILGRFGYNFFYGDSDYTGGIFGFDLGNGFCFGVGGGLSFNEKVNIEAIYSINNGVAEIENLDFDIKYSRIIISVGFSLF